MLEVIEFSVRPKNQDKKLHVFRIVFDTDKTDILSVKNVVTVKMNELFPFGFYVNKINRHLIDYVAFDYSADICELSENCKHEYLSKYLNSDDEENSAAH